MKTLRAFLYLLIGLLLGINWALSYAGVPIRYNSDVSNAFTYVGATLGGRTVNLGNLATVENAAIRATGSASWYAGTGALVQNGAITFNAALPLAATAASVAVTAVRANPAGLVTSAVASYLLSKGIEYADGQFHTRQSSEMGWTWSWNPCTQGVNCSDGQVYSTCEAAAAAGASVQQGQPYQVNCETGGFCTNWPGWDYRCYGTLGRSCPTGTSWNGSSCVGQSGSNGPAPTESDWDRARAGYWPDPAILDLVRRGVPLPTDKAVFDPPYRDVALEDPVEDPVTGKKMQQRARVTPKASSPDEADVQVVKQEVGADGQPVVNPNTGAQQAPEKETDLCKLHPEASACNPLDDAPDIEIPTQDNPFSLNPVSGFGADNASCPASVHLFNKGGQSIDWSWSQFCTFSQGIRPFVIGFAWLAAIAMVVAVGRRAG